MAKSWGEWEAALNQGMNPAVLLGLTTEKSDTDSSKITSNLTVPFEDEEFKFCLSRVPPPSLNRTIGDDVLVANPSIPVEELFPPLLIYPTTQNVQK